MSRHAAGGTAGGSADDSLLPQAADSQADRRQSSSAWWSWSFRRSSGLSWQQRQLRTVQLCSRHLPWVVSSGQLRGSFWGPQVEAEGGHVHRDMTPGIRCIVSEPQPPQNHRKTITKTTKNHKNTKTTETTQTTKQQPTTHNPQPTTTSTTTTSGCHERPRTCR